MVKRLLQRPSWDATPIKDIYNANTIDHDNCNFFIRLTIPKLTFGAIESHGLRVTACYWIVVLPLTLLSAYLLLSKQPTMKSELPKDEP